jgi:hypothetical protein
MKTCTQCKHEKPTSQFRILRKNKNGSNLYRGKCDDCYNEHYRKKYHKLTLEEKKVKQKRNNQRWSPEKRKDYKLQKNFGITLDQFKIMLQNQDNKCYICKKNILDCGHVDHCHKTGKVRKILCRNCNTGIGLLREDVSILYNCIFYLREHDNFSKD